MIIMNINEMKERNENEMKRKWKIMKIMKIIMKIIDNNEMKMIMMKWKWMKKMKWSERNDNDEKIMK